MERQKGQERGCVNNAVVAARDVSEDGLELKVVVLSFFLFLLLTVAKELSRQGIFFFLNQAFFSNQQLQQQP